MVNASSQQRPPKWFMFQVPQTMDAPAVVRSRNSVQPAQGARLWWGLYSVPPHSSLCTPVLPAHAFPTTPEILGLPGLWAAMLSLALTLHELSNQTHVGK